MKEWAMIVLPSIGAIADLMLMIQDRDFQPFT